MGLAAIGAELPGLSLMFGVYAFGRGERGTTASNTWPVM
jgi:hypothetical protein